MASQKQLEGTGVTRKGDSNTEILAPTFTMVAAREQGPYRPTITPKKTCSANLYRCIKRRLGRSRKQMHCKRHLVPSGKQVAYQVPRSQGSLSSLKRVPRPLHTQIVFVETDNTTVSYINKEGGMRLGPLGALLWRILTWCSRNQVTTKDRHIPGRLSVVADKLSGLGQTIQTVVSPSGGFPSNICSRWHRPQIDLFATGSTSRPCFCLRHQIP